MSEADHIAGKKGVLVTIGTLLVGAGGAALYDHLTTDPSPLIAVLCVMAGVFVLLSREYLKNEWHGPKDTVEKEQVDMCECGRGPAEKGGVCEICNKEADERALVEEMQKELDEEKEDDNFIEDVEGEE